MPGGPDLKLAIEETRGVMDVFTLWMPRIALVLAFVFIGATKFDNNPSGEWFRIFERIGWGQWFRYFTGAMQIAGALLMLTPWTLTLGAAMLASTMIGAMIVDVVVMHAVGYALLPLILLGFVVSVWFAGRFGAGAPKS
jgi:putative oxidoreductase